MGASRSRASRISANTDRKIARTSTKQPSLPRSLSVVGFYVGGDGRSSVSAQFCFSGWWCVALGDGWPNLPRKCQPKTSLRSGEIKDFAVFSVRQPDISGFVPRMAIYWE